VAVALVIGLVLRGLAMLGSATFCASRSLACISWWTSSRALAVHPAAAATDRPRHSLLARSLGRSTILLWTRLVLLATLTCTRRIS
jgi:uncharacterized membrane protein